MRCPHCGERDTRVVDSRDLDESATIRRRRECNACTTRFTTYERIEAARLVIVKRDGVRQEFDRDKLASGLRKALTRRPGRRRRGRGGRRRHRGRAARRRVHRGPVVAGRRAGHGGPARARPDRLHPVRQRVPELRGPRGPQARGRHAVRREGQREPAPSERPVRPRHPRRARGRQRPHRPVRPGRPAAVVGRPPPRPLVPRLPQQPLPVHRRARAAARPDRAADDRGRRAVHPPPRRVRPGPDPRMGRAARRPRGPPGGQELAWVASACSSTRRRATSTRAGRAT